MTKTNSHACYLRDLGTEIVAIAQLNKAGLDTEDQFLKGRQSALCEVLSLMKQQAELFGLSDADVGLDGDDIDSLLS